LDAAPGNFELQQNYPNPFNPKTIINYELRIDVKLMVYDALGREVQTLVNGSPKVGRHSVTFDASGLTSGIYYYKLTAGNFKQTRKMLLLNKIIYSFLESLFTL
jgi:Secretion system C-terminal sorting domain